MLRSFKDVFGPLDRKPIIGMLHLAGNDPATRLSTALAEFCMLEAAGFDAVIVENYFGSVEDVARVMDALRGGDTAMKIGINVLGNPVRAINMALEYGVDFLQFDSVSGHLRPEQDRDFGLAIRDVMAATPAAIFGGVRFKYQPVASGRSEEDDVRIGMDRCAAIVITAEMTGQETDLDKVKRFRAVTGPDFPLIIGAGLTADNVGAQFWHADGGIVGSWLKDNHKDVGAMNADHVATFMGRVREARMAAADTPDSSA